MHFTIRRMSHAVVLAASTTAASAEQAADTTANLAKDKACFEAVVNDSPHVAVCRGANLISRALADGIRAEDKRLQDAELRMWLGGLQRGCSTDPVCKADQEVWQRQMGSATLSLQR